MTWYLLSSNLLNIVSVTPVPLPQPGEESLPYSKLGPAAGQVQSLVFLRVSSAGAQQLAVRSKVGILRSLACF